LNASKGLTTLSQGSEFDGEETSHITKLYRVILESTLATSLCSFEIFYLIISLLS